MCDDGKRLKQIGHKLGLVNSTRWMELKETILYHAKLAALLRAPTKFVLLNPPNLKYGMESIVKDETITEWSIATTSNNAIQGELDRMLRDVDQIKKPTGYTPLTDHLIRIEMQLLQCLKEEEENCQRNGGGRKIMEKFVVVLATDGIPTNSMGKRSAQVDRDFEAAMKRLQDLAYIVVRLCTNETKVIEYYNDLDDSLQLFMDVLDDYFDEAKEVRRANPVITYSLPLHRCREMGIGCHSLYRWMDYLDEWTLNRKEIDDALYALGVLEPGDGTVIDGESSSDFDKRLQKAEEWSKYCDLVSRKLKSFPGWSSIQHRQVSAREEDGNLSVLGSSYHPWNPIVRRRTPLIDLDYLRGQTDKRRPANFKRPKTSTMYNQTSPLYDFIFYAAIALFIYFFVTETGIMDL